MIAIEERKDYLNSLGLRNADNTETEDYNCGGEALGTYSFYMPYNGDTEDQEDKIAELIDQEYSREEIYMFLLAEYTDFMLSDFPNLRVLSNPTEIKSNERLIYFRIGFELEGLDDEGYYDCVHFDFHYRYFEDGHWYEKCGECDGRQICDNDMEGDWECGYNIYDSRTVYLALEI